MCAQAQVDLTKANAIDFSVREEPWIKYKLEDGTLLLGRLIIPKIFRADEYDLSGQPIYAWSSQNMFTTICPKSLRGKPTSPPPTSLDPATTSTTMVDFERIGPERWNVYELSDGTLLRAKLEITGILRTDKFGPDGDPLYVVNHQPISRLKVPEKLIKKQQLVRKDAGPKGIYG
ncbi:MAG TPA: hypothetical protein VE955_02155 [Candidatus Dormibacteraeota bacterium]|nr:hypothetical protein [Candidatus Dormibacteraeota bacterium]